MENQSQPGVTTHQSAAKTIQVFETTGLLTETMRQDRFANGWKLSEIRQGKITWTRNIEAADGSR